MDANQIAGIVKRLETDKTGKVDPTRMHQNMHRASQVIKDLQTDLGDLNVTILQRDAAIKSLHADLNEANAAVTRLSNANGGVVKRSKV